MSLNGYTRLPTGQFVKDSDGSGPYNFDGASMVLPSTGSGGGGGGGGAVTIASGAVASGAYAAGSIADGADVTLGAKADAAAVSDGATATLIALFKRLLGKFGALGQQATAASISVTRVSDPDQRPGSSNITVVDSGSTSTPGQNSGSIITGVPTANSSIVVALNGRADVRAQLSGTWTGSIQFELSVDGGTTYMPVPMRVAGTVFTTSVFTANGIAYSDVAGATHLRARATAAMTGTAILTVTATDAAGAVQLLNPIRLVDNASGASATIKAASTAPLTTDTALVVGCPWPITVNAMPASIGVKLTATSLSTTIATDDAVLGALTETAPATDTASSGHNGRLQRIAQRLTSLIALLPGLGTKTMSGSQAVTLATDDTQVGAKTTASVLSAGGSGILGWLSDSVTQLKSLVLSTQNANLPLGSTPFSVTMNAPQKTFRCGFEATVASGPDTNFFTAIANGSGITVSQSGGNLVIASGTTAYSETILRSVSSFSGSMTVRYAMNLSQRIVNQQFYVELVDVIGDALAYTINSATSITVTIPGTTLTSANVGQSMYIGALTVASCPGGRYAIASVSGSAITFTVAGFPGSGSGTCSVFGWNFHHVFYDGAIATTCMYDAGRNGYASGETSPVINTTASPGHLVTWPIRDSTSGLLDELSASSLVLENTLRASRVRNVPEDETVLRIQVRCINLATAPLSTSTFTMGFIEIENFVSQQVSLVNVSPTTFNAALPVQVMNVPAVTVSSGTVTTVSTVTAVTTLTTLANGQTAHSSASTGSPVRVGGRVNTAVDTTLVAGDASDLFITTSGAVVEKPFSVPELDWQASSGLTPLATTTSTALKAAGAAGVRNYCTALQLYNNSATVSTTVTILDGAAVVWAGFLPATTAALPVVDLEVVFPTPLRGTAATAMNIQLGTASASVYYNAQGYQAP